jgi:hypothetical protein
VKYEVKVTVVVVVVVVVVIMMTMIALLSYVPSRVQTGNNF